MRASGVRAAWALAATVSGCASIAGFEDLSADCPPEQPNCAKGGNAGVSNDAASGTGGSLAGSGAGAAGGAAASGGSGAGGSGSSDAPSCGGEPPRLGRGPAMARIERPDRTCFFVDTAEVTEGQYAAYLADSPGPTDGLCSGRLDQTAECDARAKADGGVADGGVTGDLPKTCVDWCGARDFCDWAGKTLCRDEFGEGSDFELACAGTDPAPYGERCGALTCKVNGDAPSPKTMSCSVRAADATEVFDLIGNVEEWTQWCRDPTTDSPCAVRGGSFVGFDAQQCCEQKLQLPRKRRAATLGFRCCYYPE